MSGGNIVTIVMCQLAGPVGVDATATTFTIHDPGGHGTLP
jgi:hypothetical protein